jgi:hypothetical protein
MLEQESFICEKYKIIYIYIYIYHNSNDIYILILAIELKKNNDLINSIGYRHQCIGQVYVGLCSYGE